MTIKGSRSAATPVAHCCTGKIINVSVELMAYNLNECVCGFERDEWAATDDENRLKR